MTMIPIQLGRFRCMQAVGRDLNTKRQQRQAELEARGDDASTVGFADFPEESSAFVVHHTSILRNKRLLCTYM
jgi:hypothetical protein